MSVKGSRRSWIVVVALAALGVVASGVALMSYAPRVVDAGTVGSIDKVPRIGPFFEGWDTSAVRYVHYGQHRADAYYVAGTSTPEAIKAFALSHRGWDLNTKPWDTPLEPVATAMEKLDPDSAANWPKENWTLGEPIGKPAVCLGYDPETGKFWGRVLVIRGSPD